MPRLVINPGTPSTWEIQLRSGTNLLGRGFANDFKIDHPSVSSSHCQIVVENGHVALKDLGSTNGTYVNRAVVTETMLQPGQVIHLGGVEMMFQGDAPASATVTETEMVPSPPLPRPITMTPPAPPAPAATTTASGNCKFHPRTAGRYICNKCRHFFCELCVATRTVHDVQKKFCRHCGTELVAARVEIKRPNQTSFYARIPSAFVYPFKGSGVFILVVSTIVMATLDFISAGLFSIFIKVAYYGYLFSFMQNIIHSTASEDEELPGWPSIDDLGGGFVNLAACVLLSFGIAIGLYAYAFFQEEPVIGIAVIPALVFGCLYFPMALLAVGMKDTPMAANPLVVLPAIFKAPLEYLVTVIVMGVILALRMGGEKFLSYVLPSMTTHSMTDLFLMLITRSLWAFVVVYLLAVNMRILGTLYVTKKRALGWFQH